jgi:NAD(P)-dependent dehydrogenase (short-subunit alcohol dehydrogenase family)
MEYSRAVKISGTVAVVTGGASGIGRALCRRFAADGARAVVVVDRDGAGAAAVAAEIGQTSAACDVSDGAAVAALVAEVEAAHGRIDLMCSNAGVAVGGGVDAPDEDWQLAWGVNLMAHVYAARAVLPGMLARGGGTLLQTASAAGLLTHIGAAPYAVTKHAAVALAEWLAVTYGDRGIQVSCLCPMGVATPMLASDAVAIRSVTAAGRTLAPEEVAEAVVRGLEAERFLILPHAEVARYVAHKAGDIDGWLAAMRRYQAKLSE